MLRDGVIYPSCYVASESMMNLILLLSGGAACLVLAAGCLMLHIRLRAGSSLCLVLSLAAMAAWSFFGGIVLSVMFPYPPPTETAQDLQAASNRHMAHITVESALLLCFGVSFFFAAKAIPKRLPIKSLKP
jgi:hypothetical protein